MVHDLKRFCETKEKEPRAATFLLLATDSRAPSRIKWFDEFLDDNFKAEEACYLKRADTDIGYCSLQADFYCLAEIAALHKTFCGDGAMMQLDKTGLDLKHLNEMIKSSSDRKREKKNQKKRKEADVRRVASPGIPNR